VHVHVQGGFLFPSENHCFSLRKDKQDKDRQKRQGQRQARHKDRQKRQKRQGTHFCLSLSCLSFLSCPCLFCLSLSCLSFLREKQCFSEGKKKKPLSGKEEEEKRAETKNPPLDVQWVHVHVLGHPLDVERKVPRLRTRCSRNRFTRGQLLPICRHHGGVCASLFYGEGVVLLCGGTLELETSPPHPRTAYMPGHATGGSCGASRRVHGGWCCKSRARWASSSSTCDKRRPAIRDGLFPSYSLIEPTALFGGWLL